MLDIAKIEAGQQTISEEMICIGEAVSRCIEMVRGRALQTKIRIVAELPEPAAPACRSQGLQADHAQFAVERHEIHARRRRSDRARRCSDGSIWMQVADTGCGDPGRADLREIMKPFRQVEDPLIRRHEGTGLGLCLVDNLIKMHGGCWRSKAGRRRHCR